jgi:hypothetical protein
MKTHIFCSSRFLQKSLFRSLQLCDLHIDSALILFETYIPYCWRCFDFTWICMSATSIVTTNILTFALIVTFPNLVVSTLTIMEWYVETDAWRYLRRIIRTYNQSVLALGAQTRIVSVLESSFTGGTDFTFVRYLATSSSEEQLMLFLRHLNQVNKMYKSIFIFSALICLCV